MPAIGEQVWKREHTLSNKGEANNAQLAPKFSGPYTVGRVVSPGIMDLRDWNMNWLRHVHVHDLKPETSTAGESEQSPEESAEHPSRGSPSEGARTPTSAPTAIRRRGHPRKITQPINFCHRLASDRQKISSPDCMDWCLVGLFEEPDLTKRAPTPDIAATVCQVRRTPREPPALSRHHSGTSQRRNPRPRQRPPRPSPAWELHQPPR